MLVDNLLDLLHKYFPNLNIEVRSGDGKLFYLQYHKHHLCFYTEDTDVFIKNNELFISSYNITNMVLSILLIACFGNYSKLSSYELQWIDNLSDDYLYKVIQKIQNHNLDIIKKISKDKIKSTIFLSAV